MEPEKTNPEPEPKTLTRGQTSRFVCLWLKLQYFPSEIFP